MSKDKIHMPRYYNVERVNNAAAGSKGKSDTVYHKVADITLTNQLGDAVSLDKNLEGKNVLIDFFFVNCPTICPRLSGNMAMIQRAFRKNPKMENSLDTVVQFISMTVNPEHDSVPVLRAYADKYGANHDHWWFLTGDKKAIYSFARNELGLSVGQGDGGADDFIHTEKWVLLDKNRYIRGYYNGLDTADIRRCADDIVLLSLEKEKKK